MTEEVINENCKDYDDRVRFVQLIGNPELSRLEVLIFSAESKMRIPPKTQPAAYYKIIRLSGNTSASANVHGQRFRISYTDNMSGWYVPEEFKTIEHYMFQRLHDLRFTGVNNRNVNNRTLIGGGVCLFYCTFIGLMLEQFKDYCEVNGWHYKDRQRPKTIQLPNSKTEQIEEFALLSVK